MLEKYVEEVSLKFGKYLLRIKANLKNIYRKLEFSFKLL